MVKDGSPGSRSASGDFSSNNDAPTQNGSQKRGVGCATAFGVETRVRVRSTGALRDPWLPSCNRFAVKRISTRFVDSRIVDKDKLRASYTYTKRLWNPAIIDASSRAVTSIDHRRADGWIGVPTRSVGTRLRRSVGKRSSLMPKTYFVSTGNDFSSVASPS